jgi:hypothetical protein
MKKIGIVLIALVAILVLPGAAKADSFTGASGSINNFGPLFGLDGSGTFTGPNNDFIFSDSLIFGNYITIGTFTGNFTNAGFSSSSCGRGCTQYVANFVGNGSSAGETGTITLDVDVFGNIISGTTSFGGSNVPEPGTLGMFAAGLLGVGLMLSRRSKAAQVAA